VDRLLCDYSVAERIAGWRPEVSLEEGLARTADWVQGHLADLETSGYQI
jgi:nucleoside-diphosphate-sugar epimerase